MDRWKNIARMLCALSLITLSVFALSGCDWVNVELVDSSLDSNPETQPDSSVPENANPDPVFQPASGNSSTGSPFQTASLTEIHGQRVKNTWVGRVVAVTDGDTVKVLDSQNNEHRVRLAGIDAPESNQAFGKASKQELSGWVFNKQITVRTVDVDGWGRQIAFLDADGSDINASMVWAGYAWEYEQYSKSKELGGYQLEAQRQRRGLWADSNPVAPWEFRASRRKK